MSQKTAKFFFTLVWMQLGFSNCNWFYASSACRELRNCVTLHPLLMVVQNSSHHNVECYVLKGSFSLSCLFLEPQNWRTDNVNRKPHQNVANLKQKFWLILGKLNHILTAEPRWTIFCHILYLWQKKYLMNYLGPIYNTT